LRGHTSVVGSEWVSFCGSPAEHFFTERRVLVDLEEAHGSVKEAHLATGVPGVSCGEINYCAAARLPESLEPYWD